MPVDKQSRMLFVKNLNYHTKEIGDAKSALTNLNGFHLQERYIIVLYHDPGKISGRGTLSQREEELMRAKQQYGMTD
ncbi:hypothetical protein MOBT1_001385 [Malassezia obtusa]|uniref:RRM domain-containing protein n=1 Tax=Malassezia obtusa TaxID=76774 RepID=A0AAF0DYZ4_9BASI|nr:hypothetical protein MOBT1_001385 [Malassezia obtusa]